MSVRPWPDDLELRKWQQEAIGTFDRTRAENFMAVATPGAGKTLFALRVAHNLFSSGDIDWATIVCPTDRIRSQWADKANEIGLDLDKYYSNDAGAYRSEMHGVVLTYHQVGRLPDLHRWNTSQHRTLVIFDEIHHAGDENSWGNAIQTAFAPAMKRLLISGTPFRSDNKFIPYVRYEKNQSVADYKFGYGRALDEQDVVRLIEFVVYEGSAIVYSGGEWIQVDFDDAVSEDLAAKRLRVVLSDNGPWLHQVLADADQKLTEVRADGHADAGGLVICIDQNHAREVSKHLSRITKIEPALAVSDDADASAVIERFARSRDRWIVAVRMVSEGVDIPRLRVGVYATNIGSELYFRQAVGRFVRRMPGIENDFAHLFIPKDPALMRHAETIKQEIVHYLQEEAKREAPANGNGASGNQAYVAGESGDAVLFGSIFDEKQYVSEDLAYAHDLAQSVGLKGQDVQVAALLKLAAVGRTAPANAPVKKSTSLPKADRIVKMRAAIKKHVGRLWWAIEKRYEPSLIYWKLQGLDGVSQSNATEEQLEKRLEILSGWIKKALDGSDPFAS